jgi:hypothetical protein
MKLCELIFETTIQCGKMKSPALPHFHDSHSPILKNVIPQNYCYQDYSGNGGHSRSHECDKHKIKSASRRRYLVQESRRTGKNTLKLFHGGHKLNIDLISSQNELCRINSMEQQNGT